MTPINAGRCRRILLVKPSSLGDCLQALPVLNSLRKTLPQARIVWLVNTEYAGILRNHPALDDLILFPRRLFRARHVGVGLCKEVFGLWSKLQGERFDLVIDLQGLLRSAMMTLATGAPVRLGLGDARELAGAFYTHRVHLKPTDIHAVDRYMRCLELLGIRSEQREFSLPIAPGASAGLDRIFTQADLRRPDKFVLVTPGARWQSKRWPAERFAAVIDRISSELSLPCVLAGSPSEAQLCGQVGRVCRSKPLNLAGLTALDQLAALVSLSELVLGHDSGTIHLAVALGKPLICIVGPTDPKRTGPYGRSNSIVTAEVDCAPCRRSVCPDNRCMTLITVESVFEKVKSSLSAPSTTGLS